MDAREAVRILFEQAWNRQRFESLNSILAGEFDFHVGGDTRSMTVADLEHIISRWHAGFPDLEFEVHAVVASGDHAAVHATLNGTHRGPWKDLEATGRSIRVEHMFFFRLEGTRIVEVWELLDRSDMERQLTGRM